MKAPDEDAISTAAAWLRCNTGDNGEAERCALVADWIEHLEREQMLRSAARQGGVSVKVLRAEIVRKGWSFRKGWGWA